MDHFVCGSWRDREDAGTAVLDPATGEEVGTLPARRETREKQELEQRLIVGRLGEDLGHHAGLDRTRAHRGDVDACAVIRDGDDEPARQLPASPKSLDVPTGLSTPRQLELDAILDLLAKDVSARRA